ncbi:PC4 domain-containing protein [Trichonephila clavipes]|nr:PC4 domain-containing protein [Trichonephila clavipes]
MKRMLNLPNMSTKRVCFNKDDKLDSSFSESAVPPHHFHLGHDIYAAVTYFATSVQVHLRQYSRDENNRLYPTKKGVCMSTVLWQSLANRIELINVPSSTKETSVLKDALMISTVFTEEVPHITCQRYFKQKDFSRKFIPGTCVMNENSLLELAQIRKRITESAMSMVFDCIFRKLLLNEVSKLTPNVVVNTDISEVESVLTTSLIELFYEYLGSSITDVFECFGCTQGYANQLGHECITMDRETRLQLFGDLAFFAMNFEQLIQDFIQRNIQMLNYISPMFINNWDMTSVINNAKSMYITSDIYRLP